MANDAGSIGLKDDKKEVNILVIGAGMSGLACAAKLLDHPKYSKLSNKTVAVLEARNRVGGRIGSIYVNGNRLDTGANWIHGVGSKDGPFGLNPLVDILPNKDFKRLACTVSFRPPFEDTASSGDLVIESDSNDGWVRVESPPSDIDQGVSSKDLVMPPKIAFAIFGALWGLIEGLHERSAEEKRDKAKKISLLQAILQDEDFKDSFKSLPKEYHRVLRAFPQFVESMEAGPLDKHASERSIDEPGVGLLEYAIDDFDGDQVFLRDGYTAVVEELGKKVINEGHVRLGAEVQNIKWDRNLIDVSTSQGTYTAKKVVCTLPLGVLQHRISTTDQEQSPNQAPLFSPPLPPDKIEAIRSLGYGTLDKIFLVYSHPWWLDDPWHSILKKGFTSTPFQTDSTTTPSSPPSEPDALWGFTTSLPGLEVDPISGTTRPGIRALSVINLHSLTGYPVLSCFVSCANARHVESLSDSGASAIAQTALSQWFGRHTPSPEAVHVTRWAGDEFARGSYSHMITGLSETRHRDAFAKVVKGSGGAELRFAGEHTSVNHFATVHGALLSGWREAEAILKEEDDVA